ncbi:MAG: hypothetical protein P8H59_02150 [Flavobacteriales bacterium]|nr:hypothetical protein [Flavobacteriales bacterium]MDG1779726.1 hypothetical protein [Flavobacteriales bacterium]MDG2247215.1 hypothetical protein [Flavobacteriales bacterium]
MKHFILGLTLLLTVGLSAQSEALKLELAHFDEESEAYYEKRREAFSSNGEIDPDAIKVPGGLSKGFLYPSVIRALNLGNDPVLNNFTNSIDQLVVGKCSGLSQEEETAFFRRMIAKLKSDGYEVWIEMEGGLRGALLVLESDGVITSFVLLQDSPEFEGLIVVDFEGETTPEMLMELKNLDTEKLTKSLGNDMVRNLIGL